MVSANQIESHKIKDLPNNIIVLAKTSQLSQTVSKGLEGIRYKYSNNLPSNITSIKNFKRGKDEDLNFLTYGSSAKKSISNSFRKSVMKDLRSRSISSIFYVLIMLSALIHPVSFMIVMYISAIIVLAEYGKVLRKDPEHLNFLKRWGQDYSPFMSTEFFPIFMVSTFGLLPLIGPALSLTNIEEADVIYYIFIIVYLIFYPFLLFFLISKRKFYGYITSKAWPMFLLTLSLILLVSSPFLNIEFKKISDLYDCLLSTHMGNRFHGIFCWIKIWKK